MTTDDRGACRMEGPMGDEVSADEAREMIEKIRAAEGAVDLTADESAALRVVERLAREDLHG